MSELKISVLVVSPFASNCYLVRDSGSGEILVVDPGDDGREIVAKLEALGGKVVAIWNTHGHIDHINANAAVKRHTGAPIWIHEAEAAALESPLQSGASLFGIPFHPSKADGTWKGGEAVELLGRTWRIVHTPGHSPGGCCFISEKDKVMIAGDLLFAGSIGRMDLPGGSAEKMTDSLRGLFSDWGRDEWRVYPGHGPATTIANERRSNPFVLEALESGL